MHPHRRVIALASGVALLATATITLLIGTPALAASLGDADRAWIETCAERLNDEHGSTESKQKYCACMHDNFEDNEPVTQTEMERLYPPLHRYCQAKAGRRR